MSENILAPIAALSLPDAGQITQRAQSALQFVNEFVVDSAETYQMAADELKAIKARAEKIEEQRTSITKPINAALKAINDLFRGPSNFLSDAERILKSKMLAWTQEQERIAAEERRKVEEAAAAERRRLEAEAAEKQRQAEATAREAEQTGDILAASRAAEQAAEASGLATMAQIVTAPKVVAATPTVAGVSTSTSWEFEVVDMPSIIKHIASRPELANLLQIDSTTMRAYVRSLKQNTSIPGLRVFPKQTMRAAR